MSEHATRIDSTEGILLVRREGRTMAIRLTSIAVILEAVWNEPDIPPGMVGFYPETTLEHYEVEATGRADRLYIWDGADPFAKSEVEAGRAEVTS